MDHPGRESGPAHALYYRYRKSQIEERTGEVQHLDEVLQDAGIKLSSVAGQVLGKSGRDMLDALVAGTRDPAVSAEL